MFSVTSLVCAFFVWISFVFCFPIFGYGLYSNIYIYIYMDPVFVCARSLVFVLCVFSATATVAAAAAVRSEEERVCLAFPVALKVCRNKKDLASG